MNDSAAHLKNPEGLFFPSDGLVSPEEGGTKLRPGETGDVPNPDPPPNFGAAECARVLPPLILLFRAVAEVGVIGPGFRAPNLIAPNIPLDGGAAGVSGAGGRLNRGVCDDVAGLG